MLILLITHMNAQEEKLLTDSKIPASAGHTLHKGTPREFFIENFLKNHLSEKVAIGKGEIIDCHSIPNPLKGEGRPQIDIVVYKKEYPKLDLGGGINVFLIESVVAIIEVKSLLNKEELRKSIKNAHKVKRLERNVVRSFSTGYIPPDILSYVVAYDATTSNIETIYGWINSIYKEEEIEYPEWPPTLNERIKIASPSIDLITVLGKGFIKFDNNPLSLINDKHRQAYPNSKWEISAMERGNLFLFFLHLTNAVSGISASWLNPIPYAKNFRVSSLQFR